MPITSLAAALEQEHREIDAGIEGFTAGPSSEDRSEHLTRAIRALRRHIYLEEQFLFPPLHAAGVVGPLLVMLREHGQIWATLDFLERELACGDAGETAHSICRRLAVQLLHHNLKEEKILYPVADTVLSAPVATQLRVFLASGEMPEGWTCARAQTTPPR